MTVDPKSSAHLQLWGALVLLFLSAALPSVSGAQGAAADSARRARMLAEMARTKARSDSAAARVRTVVARPTHLQLRVGARVETRTLLTRLRIVGVTAAGDTVRRFSKTFALQPNPYVEQQGPDLVAKRAGSAMLWIYAGTEMTPRFFADTTRAARVEIRVR